jgi:hypothetical protein
MLLDVDVLLVSQETYEKLLRDSRELRLERCCWRVPSLPHLIAMKLHAMKYNPDRRGHDLPDIVSLLRQNPGVVARDTMAELCRQFGTAEVFPDLDRMGLWKI